MNNICQNKEDIDLNRILRLVNIIHSYERLVEFLMYDSKPIYTVDDLKELQHNSILKALELTNNNQVQAAKLLGMNRQSIMYHMKKMRKQKVA